MKYIIVFDGKSGWIISEEEEKKRGVEGENEAVDCEKFAAKIAS